MHTTQLGKESHFHVDTSKRRFVAHHNGDFSGDVIISELKNKPTAPGGVELVGELRIPFDMLLVLFGHYKLYQEQERLDRIEAMLAQPGTEHLMRDYARGKEVI